MLFTACWLIDNHHQFRFSSNIARIVDGVFPAHANGHAYLHAGRAIVGPTIPCGILQWSRDDLERLFTNFEASQRTNSLYGRFTSAGGRNAHRDVFLRRVAEEIAESSISIFEPNKQDWWKKSESDRFRELMTYKVSICNPIYHDVPIRIFDALAAGQIPIVPYGLLGFELAIPGEAQKQLPVVRYILSSVHSAYDTALDLFDAGGPEAARARHEYVVKGHLVYHRLRDMVGEILGLAKPSSMPARGRGR